MHTVLGLSLQSTAVAWVLLDADGKVLDHDAVQCDPDSELAGAVETAGVAARGAHAIATACGFEIDRTRLTWTGEIAARDGVRLRERLGCAGFGEVEAVPMPCATAVLVDPEATGITPRLALAYGAALAVVDPSAAHTVPVTQQIRRRGGLRRGRIASAALGVAAAAVLGLLCLSAGAGPQLPPATATATATAEVAQPPDAGWAAVLASPEATTAPARKVVVTPPVAEPPSAIPAQTHVPARTVAATAAPSAPSPTPVPAELPHLSGANPAVGPATPLAGSAPDLTDPAAASAPQPELDMTEVMQALSALP